MANGPVQSERLGRRVEGPLRGIYNSILETIGNTPLVRINSITRGVTEATVVAKLETFNPVNTVKSHLRRSIIALRERLMGRGE